VMAQSLVGAAASYWHQQGVKFRIGQDFYNNHVLSYLELLPRSKNKANRLVARIARKYKGLQFIYHPYHLIHQQLDAAYEISHHQIYLGHAQVKDFTLRNLDLLHELRHARRKSFQENKRPSFFYGFSTSFFPEMMNYSVYQRQIMHDEPLGYFAEIKSMVYSWERAWRKGLWRRQKLLRGRIINYAAQAYLISVRIREIVQFWLAALSRGQTKVSFTYTAKSTLATLTWEIDGRIEQTQLPMLNVGHLPDEQKKEILYRTLQSMADGVRHYQEIFAAIKDFFVHFDETKFTDESFQMLVKVLRPPHPR
ncbi:MAG: hypothetical protein J6Y94_04895, partial [Bacteriovoracaceae bacterium]|nr:hypothetical protein [Bacteriovoracaceae bacterium]